MGLIFDTYALLAWFRDGDERYRTFFESKVDKLITPLILMEFYFFLFHFSGKAKAEAYRKVLKANFRVLPLSERAALSAARTRSRMHRKKRKMSYADCLSLALAAEHGHEVLSGDKHFKGLRGAVFVE